MRYANRSSVVDHAIVAAMLLALAVGAYAGVKLVAGGSGDDAPSAAEIARARFLLARWELPNTTPLQPVEPMPTRNPINLGGFSFPTQAPTPKGPESVEISGVVIPIPEGARYSHFAGPEGPLLHQIWFGGSNFRETESGVVAAGVQFDEFGLVHADFEGPQADALVPTLDALWALAKEVGTPSPPSLVVDGADIPLPEGSYYNTEEVGAMGGPEIIDIYHVRFEHSVIKFVDWDSGLPGVRVVSNNVRPRDEARFQPTLETLDILTAATLKAPEFVEISDVVVPIPEGSRYSRGTVDNPTSLRSLRLGDSTVTFNDYGLAYVSLEASDEEVFEPTLDALWMLTQRVSTPSPPSLVVKGVDIPLPEGSYYSTVEAQWLEDTIVRYYVRFEHSVLSFEHWAISFEPSGTVSNDVRPRDEARFQPTLDAIALLAPTD